MIKRFLVYIVKKMIYKIANYYDNYRNCVV